MLTMKFTAGILLGLLLSTAAIAQDVNLNDVPESPGKQKVEAADANPHPEISTDSSWATAVVIGIVGMFAAAILVGIFVPPPAPPAAHGHDDHDHGSHGHDDHAHGAQGHDDHAHGH